MPPDPVTDPVGSRPGTSRLTGVSDPTGGRRQHRKAQTRATVRETAHRLFAERGFDAVTIADVAAAAEVAVQTVFNHFETKEALFFAGRRTWMENTVAAVTQRPPGTDPVGALRSFLEEGLIDVLDQESRPEGRGELELLAGSPGLQARERTLVELTSTRVGDELGAAIAAGEWPAAPDADPVTARVLGRLIADLLISAGRVLVLENRTLVLGPERDGPQHRSTAATATATMAAIEQCARALAAQLLDQPG